MKVYVIDELNHGFLGVAKSHKSAIEWLIKNHWLTECDDLHYNETSQKWETVKEVFGDEWKEKILNMSNDEFNDCFLDGFRIEEYDLIGE